MRSIRSIKFPAVTICHSTTGKWMGIAKALAIFDRAGLIFDFVRNMNWDFHGVFINNIWEPSAGFNMHDPPLYETDLLDNLRQKLGFDQYETEVFALIHLLLFTNTKGYDRIDPSDFRQYEGMSY